jgi:hypothetical protein
MISIGEPTLEERDGKTYLIARIDGTPRTDTLWYSVPAEYGEALSPTGTDAFVLAVLPLAMADGSNIAIHGSLSERLAYHLPRNYMPILSRFVPRLREVQVSADRVEPRCLPDSRGVATGVSGGIDSFVTLADHYLDEVQPSFRLTHLLFHNIGSHGRGAMGDRIFQRRRRHLSALADELGLPLIPVDSNLHYALPLPYARTHTLRSVSVAHALARLIGRFLYSASIEYRDVTVGPMRDISNVDPIALPLLATEATDCVLAGGQYTRIAKTERVAGIELSYRYLDVCVAPEHAPAAGQWNCSRCWKCTRTMLTFELLGTLDRYGAVFDLDDWNRNRSRRVTTALAHGGPLVREIFRLARRERMSLPLGPRVVGSAVRLGRHARNTLINRRLRTEAMGR